MISTARLRLRPLEESDQETLVDQWNDPDVGRYLWDAQPVSRETVAGQIAASRRNFETRGYGLFVIGRLEAPEDVVGFAGLRPLEDTGEVELLYGLLPAFWGRGFATEAARAVLRFGFEGPGLPEIVAGADPPNAASFRVMERLGMTFLRDTSIGGRPARYYRLRREAFTPA